MIDNSSLKACLESWPRLLTRHLKRRILRSQANTEVEVLMPSGGCVRGYPTLEVIAGEIGDLSALKCLDLSYCGLSGELPPSLGNLTQIEYVDISYNDNINGSIPPELGNLVILVSLNWSANSLIGKIPSELGFLSNLVDLDLHNNKLFGPIPFTLYHMTDLEHLYLDHNYLEGSISKNIENFKKISFLSITNNRFTGHITIALCCLPTLEILTKIK
ncbi:hypothetical protein J1N35_019413 [Gossypium stocksii]|uniref:Leucine-rich repeat-containing N-terminal plant-type domain-containing protein n=1 Tax=Gossypium stocksii TaxID=47602 RepID=A0A9D4A880_9ROSI|nr:hypothetical protein J1N35_019413 [Gossypium stocksii]